MFLGLCRIAIVFACAVACRAEIIDQVAATVDNQVITSSQVMEEIRVTAFLNGERPDFSPANRRKTADRLIEQYLVQREMELTYFPQPSRSEIEASLKKINARLGSEAAYRRALAEYHLTEAQLTDALLRQSALLQFIDLRFRPEVQITEEDLMNYYDTVYLPEIRKKNVQPEPSFDDVRDQIEQAIAADLVDKRVDRWLQEARSRTRITYEEDAFQ